MGEHEQRDVMNVDSFSQLPFIRPTSTETNANTKPPCTRPNQPLRLFGIDFHSDETTSSETNTPATAAAAAGGTASGDSGRKFECHYCCRNFPTSQALGGHQNAHKRERQQAKRAHLQSSAAAIAAHHHYHHQLIPPPSDVYGALLNYRRMGSAPSAARFVDPPPPPHYPSWNASGNAVGPRFYGGLGSVSQPINGSPVAPGLWGVPGVVHRHQPVFGEGGGGSMAAPFSSSSASAQGDNYGHELGGGAKDSVSLDLHL